MSVGFSSVPAEPSLMIRALELSDWVLAGSPLLRDPRHLVKDLYIRHNPRPTTAVLAVLDPNDRLVASASFTPHSGMTDGWDLRNGLLWHLRRVIPHDLRRRSPVRTGVLVLCRDGEPEWTESDGAWMWGLRDACALHGLRCGAYVTLTPVGWQVLGEGRCGRTPQADETPVRSSTETTLRPAAGGAIHVPHRATAR